MLNKYQKKELREDYSFHSNQELMDKYHLTLYQLRQIVNDMGLKLKKHTQLTKEQRYYILDNPHKPYSELAKELGVTYIMVARALRSKSKK